MTPRAPASPSFPAGLDDLVAAATSSSYLASLDREGLVALLGRVREGRGALDRLEDDVLLAASTQGASLRTLAAALQVGSPEGVSKRLRRISTHS